MPLFKVKIKRQVVETVEVVVDAAEPQDIFASVAEEYGDVITHADNVESWEGEMKFAWVERMTRLDKDAEANSLPARLWFQYHP